MTYRHPYPRREEIKPSPVSIPPAYVQPENPPDLLDSRFTAFIKAPSGYPYTYANLRAEHPGVSFPEQPTASLLANYGVYPVQPTPAPSYDPALHALDEMPPALIEGVWTQQWAVSPHDLDRGRAALHAKRQAWRDAAETGGFTYLGHRVDSDRESVLRIAHAAALAMQAIMASAPWGLEWTCADNTELALDAPGMLGLQAALAMHSAGCHAQSRQWREAIDAAVTLDDLAAVAAAIDSTPRVAAAP